MAVGTNRNATPAIRLLMLAAERSDRTGLAVFDAGELQELLHDNNPQKTAEHVLHIAAAVGYVLPDSTAEKVRIDLALIQPDGFAEVGARYGDLTLMHRVDGDRWLCACQCGSRRTYMLPYLAGGITVDCGQHRPVETATPR